MDDNKDNPDSKDKLRQFFFGELPQQDKPSAKHWAGGVLDELSWGFIGHTPLVPGDFIASRNCTDHEWVEVTLFHTPRLRCRHCDIKKSDL